MKYGIWILFYFALGACYSSVLPSSVYAKGIAYTLLYGFSSVIFWPIFLIKDMIWLHRYEKRNKK